jgi:hypothetical protein
MPMDAVSAARSGMVGAAARFEGATLRLATAFVPPVNEPISAIVEELDARSAFRASAATLGATNKTFKALLDIKV